MTVPQRFVGPSARAVMGEARRILGDGAIIIDQRTVNGQVELIAAAGVPETAELPPASEAMEQTQQAPALDLSTEEILIALPEVPADRPLEAARPASVAPPLGKLQELRQLGFSATLLRELSAQALTPRVAINELLQRCRFTDWRALNGLVPVIGPAGAGVTTATLRATTLILNLPGTRTAPALIAADRDGIANGEKLRQAASLLGLQGAVSSPTQLRALAATLPPGQVAFFDLPLGSVEHYSDPLNHLLCHELVTDMALVVPAHWEPAVVATELEALACVEDRPVRKHLLFSGLDRCERIAPWLERALNDHWHIGLLGAGSELGIPAEAASEAALRRLLLRHIDRLQGSTMVTEESDSVAGADLCMQYR